ncbi:beta-ketoacyl synthase chain length factor [Psychromonas ossibalaenae]|uniref:beta-ketoacyl synthase chain length factor n=1 Tax=Psychromonas ossibalaenae TaxID=444922 RepID=UPI00035D1ADA|nr:beta-ketoacyl synthase chain length factor [Psychromonas ossibalaenae]
MDFINFNITNWFAICPGIAGQKKWHEQVNKQPLCLGVLNETPVNLIPAMMRRRMSSLSKLAVQTAIQLSQHRHTDYIVFASRHGELTRTVKLIEDILSGDDASPIMFSQSVHNTAAGLFTISAKQPVPVCSLAAGENTLHSALLEAACYLQEHPDHNVLVVNFDEPLPDPYLAFEKAEHQGFALGVLLSGGDQFKIKAVKQETLSESSCPQAFSCIDYLLSQQKNISISGKKTAWFWEKN